MCWLRTLGSVRRRSCCQRLAGRTTSGEDQLALLLSAFTYSSRVSQAHYINTRARVQLCSCRHATQVSPGVLCSCHDGSHDQLVHPLTVHRCMRG